MAKIIDANAVQAKSTIDDVNDFIDSVQEVEEYRQLWSYEKRQSMEPRECKRLSENMRTMLKEPNLNSPKLHEMISSGKAEFLVPQFIIGPVLEGMAPTFQISSLFQTIQYSGGTIVQFPALGELRAFVIAEGQDYPEQDYDVTQYRNLTMKVEKHGLMCRITEETIENAQWDVMGYWLRAAGRALGRLKEEQCTVAMMKHGHILFDALSSDPHYQPTGVDVHNNLNNTLSIMDFVDILAAALYNEKVVTDVIMHPLAAMTFFKNELIGAYGQRPISYIHPWQTALAQAAKGGISAPNGIVGGGTTFEQMADIIGRNLPLPLNIHITPYAPLDRVNKRFSVIFFDRDNVGVIIQKEGVMTEDWDEPKRDIHCVKLKEKYGIGVTDQGRGIIIARNLALAPTYYPPFRTEQVN